MKHADLLSIFAGQPLAMHEPELQSLLGRYFAAERTTRLSSDGVARDSADHLPVINELIVAEGVAVVPLQGLMVKRSRIVSTWWDDIVLVGSDHIADIVDQLALRADIRHILIDADSGGGQVAGTERLADAVWRARLAGKNTIGVVNEFAASACLWVVAQCEHVVMPATASIGSLGVYTIHIDNTKAWQEYGYEKSVIHRGKYKGQDERPLDAAGRKDLQRFIDAKYSLFVDAVARGRNLTAAEVIERWGESQLFSGSEATDSGLVDELGTLQDVLESLNAGRCGRVTVLPPAADLTPVEGEPEAMKLNAQGQILDAAGKVVGALAELQLTADQLQQACSDTVGGIVSAAVKAATDKLQAEHTAKATAETKATHERLQTLVAAVGAEAGVAAFIAGHTIDQAKAGLAEKLQQQLAARDKELAELKAQQPTAKKPAFLASDADGSSVKADAKDRTEFAADWDADKEGCQAEFGTEALYATFRRNASRFRGGR